MAATHHPPNAVVADEGPSLPAFVSPFTVEDTEKAPPYEFPQSTLRAWSLDPSSALPTTDWENEQNAFRLAAAVTPQTGLSDRKVGLLAVATLRLFLDKTGRLESTFWSAVRRQAAALLQGLPDGVRANEWENAADSYHQQVEDVLKEVGRFEQMPPLMEQTEILSAGLAEYTRQLVHVVYTGIVLQHTTDQLFEFVLCKALDYGYFTQAEMCSLIREIFPDPLRPVTFDPAWGTEEIAALAAKIYADREFHRMPELADVLEDEENIPPDVVAHCRKAGGHSRGCWVIDGLLGKS